MNQYHENFKSGLAELQETVSVIEKVSFEWDTKRPLLISEFANKFQVKKVTLREFDPDKYQKLWMQVKKDGFTHSLSSRDFKHICWIADLVKDNSKELIEYIRNKKITINSNGMAGLLFSLHYYWSSFSSDLAILIQELVRNCTSKNKIILRWQGYSNIEQLTSLTGPKFLADSCYNNRDLPSIFIEDLAIQSNTEFAEKFVYELALRTTITKKQRESDWLKDFKYLIQIIENISTKNIKLIITDCFVNIIHIIDESDNEQLKEEVQKYLLNHKDFGDPRTSSGWPSFKKNKESENAENIFVQWLAKEDIEFFFKNVITTDPHGRKDFWLRYIKHIKKSRVALSYYDKHKLAKITSDENQRGPNHASCSSNDISAFILDFGNYVAVEFSKKGNACYIYTKKDFDELNNRNFYKKEFKVDELKRQSYTLPPYFGFRQVHHNTPGKWQRELSNWLAGKGIRP